MPIDRGYASAMINVHVWSGLRSPKEIEQAVLGDCSRPEDITGGDATWVGEEVERVWSAKLEEEKSWPDRTDWDRLYAAFANLKLGGIIALHEAGFAFSDAPPIVAEAYRRRGAEESGVEGFCFYPWQEIEHAISGDGLELVFGDFAGDPLKSVEIGRRVAAAVEGSGLRTTRYDTVDKDSCILVNMRWQKRYHRYRAALVQEGSPATATAGSWDDFTANLSRDLAGLLAHDDTRIFNRGARYVQMWAGNSITPPWPGAPVTVLETVSNMYLPPDQSLTADEEQTLRRLGWGEPKGPGPSNWRLEYQWPLNASQAAEAARVLTDTIRAVLPDAKPSRSGGNGLQHAQAQRRRGHKSPYREILGWDPTWDDITADLGRDLAGMREGDARIFSYGARYAQVAAGPRVTALETVSNMYLPPDQSLTPDEEQTLRRLGWGEPESPGPSNWRLEYPWPLNAAQAAEAARVLTDTIRAVLRTPSPGDVQIKAL